MKSPSKSSPSPHKIGRIPIRSSPARSVSEEGEEGGRESDPARIRRHELTLMHLEEARRHLVIQEELQGELFYNHHYEATPQSTDNLTTPRSEKLKSIDSPTYFSPFKTPPKASSSADFTRLEGAGSSRATPRKSNLNADVVISWLCFPRLVTMRDRNCNKQFLCVVERESSDQSSFALKWYLPPGDLLHSFETTAGGLRDMSPEGYVTLQEIKSMSMSSSAPSILQIILSGGVHALRSSRGRTSLSLEFSTAQECAKFKTAVETLV
jgi:hypothetical protein